MISIFVVSLYSNALIEKTESFSAVEEIALNNAVIFYLFAFYQTSNSAEGSGIFS